MRRWRDCIGLWPRLVQFGCRRKWPFCMNYAARQVLEEIEDERTQQILEAVWTSGEAVTGTVDEEGRFIIERHGWEP